MQKIKRHIVESTVPVRSVCTLKLTCFFFFYQQRTNKLVRVESEMDETKCGAIIEENMFQSARDL